MTNARLWEFQWHRIMATTPVDPSAGASSRRPSIDTRADADRLPGSVSHAPAAGSTSDDLETVRRVVAGDRDAFRVLVERESASVIRTCYRVLADMHEAEDVAQETFVTAYRSLSTWRSDGPFGAWLTRIAVRLAVRQLGHRRAVSWLRTPGDESTNDVAALAGGASTQPEYVALRAERASATRRAVANLAEPYREIVALRFFGERSLDEIAAVTGRPLGTVKTQLRRGLMRLREQLDIGGAA